MNNESVSGRLPAKPSQSPRDLIEAFGEERIREIESMLFDQELRELDHIFASGQIDARHAEKMYKVFPYFQEWRKELLRIAEDSIANCRNKIKIENIESFANAIRKLCKRYTTDKKSFQNEGIRELTCYMQELFYEEITRMIERSKNNKDDHEAQFIINLMALEMLNGSSTVLKAQEERRKAKELFIGKRGDAEQTVVSELTLADMMVFLKTSEIQQEKFLLKDIEIIILPTDEHSAICQINIKRNAKNIECLLDSSRYEILFRGTHSSIVTGMDAGFYGLLRKEIINKIHGQLMEAELARIEREDNIAKTKEKIRLCVQPNARDILKSRMYNLRLADMVRILRKFSIIQARITGSHVIFRNERGISYPIPMQKTDTVGGPIVLCALKAFGIREEDFIRHI